VIALAEHVEGTVLPVHAKPGGRKDRLAGEHAGAVRVEVTAAPERGKATEAIAAVLAEALGVKASDLRLLAGPTSRQKKFLVVGMGVEEVRGRLATCLASDSGK
jgi:uncharacterized protein YggU (UPF0235/DUF167 family)